MRIAGDRAPMLESNAGQAVAILALPRIINWIRECLKGHPILEDSDRGELRPRFLKMMDDAIQELKGGRQRVIEFEMKMQYTLELRMFIAIEQSLGERDWQPVAASWYHAVFPDWFDSTDFHFNETHLVCPACGDKGEAWRFEMNRTCSCGQTLKIANMADIN